MAEYDFDRWIDRQNTNSLKYDFAKEWGYPETVLPLWVADMDFQAAQPIQAALHRVVDHGIYGYSESKQDYYAAVADWFADHFSWRPEHRWLIKTPGVVFALANAIRAFTEPGDAVLVQTPVYYPFLEMVQKNHRHLVENELIYENGVYRMDLSDLEEKIRKNHVKLFLLCSPHNPVGRVWNIEELKAISRICREHGVIIVSDEIHCDFALPGFQHHILLEACPELQEQAVICTAPSKTFNLAGLNTSNIWIPNGKLRKRFQAEMEATGCYGVNRFGIFACQAAYAHGAEWLSACKKYLKSNLDYVRTFLREHLPQIHLVEPEGTYFAWLDCSGLGFTQTELETFIKEKANLWLDGGSMFGSHSGQFQRIVLACPKQTLQQAMEQLYQAVINC